MELQKINKLMQKNSDKFTWEFDNSNNNHKYTQIAKYKNITLNFFENSDYCGYGYILEIDSSYITLIPLSRGQYDWWIISRNVSNTKKEKNRNLSILNKIKFIFGADLK